MENILPAEILQEIFLYLNISDVQSVSETCIHWRNVINNFKVWQYHWYKLLKDADNTYMKYNTCIILKRLKILDLIDQKSSCIRLRNILQNNKNQIHKCLSSIQNFEYAVLKTHHSHVMLKLFQNVLTDHRIMNKFYYIKKEKSLPNTKFNTPNMCENIKKLFHDKLIAGHIHVRLLIYCYPMEIHILVTNYLIKEFFETLHIEDIICIPRAVVICYNLNLQEAVVVYSTSKSTEVSVVKNSVVMENRWCTLPIGGWQVAQHLHSAYMWLNPDAKDTSIQLFEDSVVKSRCWLNTSAEGCAKRENVKFEKQTVFLNSNGNKIFILENEQYLAPELMYIQLGLPAVIKKLLDGLPESDVSNCLNHVIISGGNSNLQYFSTRLKLDLIKLFPDDLHIITTSIHNVNMLGYLPQREIFETEKTKQFHHGQPSRISRDQYIVNGI